MRRLRARFTIRQAMIAMAAAAMALAVGVEAMRLARLAGRYRQKAAHFARLAETQRALAADWEEMASDHRARAELLRRHRLPEDYVEIDPDVRARLETLLRAPSESAETLRWVDLIFRSTAENHEDFARSNHDVAARMAREADQYEALGRKYDRAASRPWRTVAPDLPGLE